MLWSFPASSLPLFTSPPLHSAALPASIFQGRGVEGVQHFSPQAWWCVLQILSRALVQTRRCWLSGLPAPLTRTLTWARVLQALCLLPWPPWRRSRWSCSALTFGSGSMTLGLRWSSPKRAGKDVFLWMATFKEWGQRRSYSIPSFHLLVVGSTSEAKVMCTHVFASGHLGEVLMCFLWLCHFSPRATET